MPRSGCPICAALPRCRTGCRPKPWSTSSTMYFDCQVAAIRNHGGEVLKFMGDGLLAVFPIDEYVGDEQQVCSRVLEAARESRASVAGAAISDRGVRSNAFASASRCMSGKFSTAISAAATGSTSPASVRRSILRRGWKRSPAGCIAPWWRRKASPASAGAAGAISASFRSPDSRRPSASSDLVDEIRRPSLSLTPATPRARW